MLLRFATIFQVLLFAHCFPQHLHKTAVKHCTREIATPALICTNVTSENIANIVEEEKEHPDQLIFKNSRMTSLNLQQFDSEFFKNCEYLDLTNSFVHSISDRTFRNLTKLKELLLNNNNITNILYGTFSGLEKLLQLDMSCNQIDGFLDKDNLTGLMDLKYLNVENNIITRVSSDLFEYLPNLNEINLSHNNLQSTEDVFLNISTHKCSIEDSNSKVKSFNNCITINLAHNNFTSLPKIEGIGIKNLSINNNQICNLQRASFKNYEILLYLRLDYNCLTSIQKEVFDGLKNLLNLNLSHNEIESIDRMAFAELYKLEILDLSHNSLTVISYDSFQELNSIKSLNLTENPLICDTKNELLDILQNNNTTTVRIEYDFSNCTYENGEYVSISSNSTDLFESTMTNLTYSEEHIIDKHGDIVAKEIYNVKIALSVLVSIKIVIVMIFLIYRRISKKQTLYNSLNSSEMELEY